MTVSRRSSSGSDLDVGRRSLRSGRADAREQRPVGLARVEQGPHPVVAEVGEAERHPLDPLDEAALLNILTQPRNAIVKQYQKLFALEGVELELEESALKSVVDLAMERGTGARALRSIIESVMLDVMYHLPSRENVSKCIITKDTIIKSKDPVYLYEERKSA